MASDKTTKIFMILIVGILSLIAIVVFTGAMSGDGGINLGDITKLKVEKFKVSCDVNINNPIGDPELESVNCQKEKCSWVDLLSFFSNTGNVDLILNGQRVASSDYKVTEFGGNTQVKLTSGICMPKEQLIGRVVLRNEQKIEIDSKSVDLR